MVGNSSVFSTELGLVAGSITCHHQSRLGKSQSGCFSLF